MRNWFAFNLATETPALAEIVLSDFIGDWIDGYWGFGVTAKQFLEQLAALPADVKTIRVRINSPGGDVSAASQMANALRDQASKGRAVEAVVEGLSASAATIVMMGAQQISIAANALVMIHNPWSVAMGEAGDLRKAADTLDKFKASIITAYQWHSALPAEQLGAMMDVTTWMSASEAVENGFASRVIEGVVAAASIDPSALEQLRVPDQYRARVAAFVRPGGPAPAPVPAEPAAPAATAATAVEVLGACREAGLLELAEGFLAANASAAAVRDGLAAEQTRRAAAAARERDIRALCSTARLEELADAYIGGGMPLDQVRAQLAVITAKLDEAVTVDGSLPLAERKKVDAAALVFGAYARH